MSLRVSAPSLANTSPSVALEKGAYYRTRASHKRTIPDITPPNLYIHRRGRSQNKRNTQFVALSVLLVFTCLTCFGTAYYLFKTRWESPVQNSPLALHANTPSSKVDASIYVSGSPDDEPVQPEELFLAYLPHSGFHNQRIAFENALVLARLLNRTLIVPPVRLGNTPIPYYPFDRLSRQLALADKTGLGHCVRVPPRIAVPPECLGYFDYTYLPWDWLVNLTSVRAKQRLRSRWNFGENWFNESLGILDGHVLHFRDATPYQYRFVDSERAKRVEKKNWYMEDISLDSLGQKRQKLLFFGTLFGSTRLKLKEEVHLAVRKEIREAMTIMHPVLDLVSETIFRALGSAYLSIHLRAAEPKFRPASEVNVRTLWWTLLKCFLNTTIDDTARLEQYIQRTGTAGQISQPLLSRDCIPLNEAEKSHLTLAAQSRCRQSRIYPFPLSLLGPNPPLLYVATDLKNTLNEPLLKRFRATFPCTLGLSDFADHLAPLNHVINPIDGVPLRSHLLPFIDALVAAKALRVVGTTGSTFSYYIEDVLWRHIHRLPIKQRG